MQEPELYLGSQVSKFYIEGAENPEKSRWAMLSEKYARQAVTDIELDFSYIDQCLPTRVTTPISQGYRPKLD